MILSKNKKRLLEKTITYGSAIIGSVIAILILFDRFYRPDYKLTYQAEQSKILMPHNLWDIQLENQSLKLLCEYFQRSKNIQAIDSFHRDSIYRYFRLNEFGEFELKNDTLYGLGSSDIILKVINCYYELEIFNEGQKDITGIKIKNLNSYGYYEVLSYGYKEDFLTTRRPTKPFFSYEEILLGKLNPKEKIRVGIWAYNYEYRKNKVGYTTSSGNNVIFSSDPNVKPYITFDNSSPIEIKFDKYQIIDWQKTFLLILFAFLGLVGALLFRTWFLKRKKKPKLIITEI